MQCLRDHGCTRCFWFSVMKIITRQTKLCSNKPDEIQTAKGKIW